MEGAHTFPGIGGKDDSRYESLFANRIKVTISERRYGRKIWGKEKEEIEGRLKRGKGRERKRERSYLNL